MLLIKRDLQHHRGLFRLYLVVLALIFVGALGLPWPDLSQVWLERGMIFLASMAVILSFELPSYLTRRHLDSLTQIINSRRPK